MIEEERVFHLKKAELNKLLKGKSIYRRIKPVNYGDPHYIVEIQPLKKYWTAD